MGTARNLAYTPVSGNGGTVTVYNSSRNASNGVVTPAVIGGFLGVQVPTGTPYTFTGVTKWELTKKANLAEVTHAGSLGWEQRKSVTRGAQFTLEFVWDAGNVPDSDVTLDAGDEPVIRLKRGANAGYYWFPAIVETMKLVDDEAKDVMRGTISGYANGPIRNVVSGPTNGA